MEQDDNTNQPQPRRRRPFVGIIYDCCNAYGRVYLNRKGTAFRGQCPRCLKSVVLRVSEDGSTERFLRVN